MNIFYLHKDPKSCAQQHCDKHSSKMCVEYAQLLSTAHRVLDGELWFGRSTNGRKIARYFHPDSELNAALYKASHINHPSAKWVRESINNYEWLYNLWIELCNEYSFRYEREHLSFLKLEEALLIPPANAKDKSFTEPPPAMKQYPQCIVQGDSIQSYKNYYWEAKREFATWTKREPPEWWVQKIIEG